LQDSGFHSIAKLWFSPHCKTLVFTPLQDSGFHPIARLWFSPDCKTLVFTPLQDSGFHPIAKLWFSPHCKTLVFTPLQNCGFINLQESFAFNRSLKQESANHPIDVFLLGRTEMAAWVLFLCLIIWVNFGLFLLTELV
jgi:hypothetical protein